MCNKTLCSFKHVPDDVKTQEMCKRVVEEDPAMLIFVPDQCKTPEISKRAAAKDSHELEFVPMDLSTQEMGN